MTTQKCSERISTEWGDRKESISALNDWEIREYPLCFDYVEAKTFHDQPEGYHRYQISWGGPQDEIRFYDEGGIYFAYLDWYDGAEIPINQEPITKWLIKMFDLYE